MIAHSCPCCRIARLHLLVCDKCHCTPHGPVHQLRGRLPATKSLCTDEHVSKSALLTLAKGLLWLQPVKQAIFQAFDRGLHQTKNGNGPRLFSLPPKSFRNCPNRPVMQRVLGQLAPSRYSSLWYLSTVSLSADVDTESGIQCRRRVE
ncbi:hypothetical protein FOFC_15750 [Fusarium oxysporum]|nr:hypothetical protein FOFC_15750 [Fusarium oxysporum]